MGDRSNIKFKQEEDGVIWLYAHWEGSNLALKAKAALASTQARGRWDDEPYLTKIICSQIFAGTEKEATGYGLTTYPTDSNNNDLEIDCAAQAVRVTPHPDGKVIKEWTFEEFCKGGDEEIIKLIEQSA